MGQNLAYFVLRNFLRPNNGLTFFPWKKKYLLFTKESTAPDGIDVIFVQNEIVKFLPKVILSVAPLKTTAELLDLETCTAFSVVMMMMMMSDVIVMMR